MSRSIYDISKRYTVNAVYFDRIETEHQAYWLGLLWADGSINKTTPRSSGPNRMRLVQLWTRKYLIEQFLEDIEADVEIKRIDKAGHAPIASIDINSRPLCMNLERLGFGLKRNRIKVPPMDATLLHHFLRGYFDGDGCLSLYTQQMGNVTVYKQEWSLTGQNRFLENLRAAYEPVVGIVSNTKMKRYKRTSNAVSLRYGGKLDVLRVCSFMYKDATVYLKEKRMQYDRFLLRPNMRNCVL